MSRLIRVLLVIASLVLTFGGLPVHADSLDPAARARLEGLAMGLQDEDALVRTLLIQLGFPPPSTPETWRQWEHWPSVRMLEVAYVSAEAAHAGGGQDLLAKFARIVAANYNEAIRYEPALQGIFHEPAGTPIVQASTPHAFDVPKPEALKVKLRPEIRRMIRIISLHTSGANLPWLFARCCNVNEDESYDIMRAQPDEPSAMEAALGLKEPPPTLDQKFDELLKAVHEENPAFAYDPAVADRVSSAAPKISDVDLMDADSQVLKGIHDYMAPVAAANAPPEAAGPFPPPNHPLRPTPGPVAAPPSFTGTGGGGPPPAMAEETYRAFEASRYPGPRGGAGRGGGAWSFRRMSGRVFGFGGVIFGNEVSVQPGLPAPTRVFWQQAGNRAAPTSPDVSEAWGRLGFVLKDGRTVMTHLVRADSVTAAIALAYDPRSRTADAGYGLVGYVGRFRAATVDDVDQIGNNGLGLSFVVHPSVAATRLGHAMMVLDTLPMISRDFVQQVGDDGGNQSQLDQLKDILAGKYGKLGQYKFTDVKLRVTADAGGVIGVQRDQGDAPGASEALRRQAYVTLISFDGDQPRAESKVPMYALIPLLATVTDPFSRANEFAEVFALLRWAKAAGATWMGPRPPAGNVRPATALVVSEDGAYLFGASAAAFEQSLANQVDLRAAKITSESGNQALMRMNEELHQHFSKLIQARAAISATGTVSEALGAVFSADATLARRHAEIAEKAAAASTFRRDAEVEAKQLEAEEWLNLRVDELDRIVPGIKARKSLTDTVSAEAAWIDDAIDDPIALLNRITNNVNAQALKKITDDLANADTDAKRSIELGDAMEREIRKTLPGFLHWIQVQTALRDALAR